MCDRRAHAAHGCGDLFILHSAPMRYTRGMKTLRHISVLTAAGLAVLLAASASGQEWTQVPGLLAQGAPDCYAVGQQVAAQQGGTLAKATAEQRGGQTVCRIVVLVPGRNGERPRRAEFTVPAR